MFNFIAHTLLATVTVGCMSIYGGHCRDKDTIEITVERATNVTVHNGELYTTYYLYNDNQTVVCSQIPISDRYHVYTDDGACSIRLNSSMFETQPCTSRVYMPRDSITGIKMYSDCDDDHDDDDDNGGDELSIEIL